MAEWHDDGLTKQERYAMEKRRTNQEFDKKLDKKSFFTSSRSIEEERSTALRKLDEAYYGKRSGGCFSE